MSSEHLQALFGSGLYYVYLVHVTRFCVKGNISVSFDWVELVVMVGPPSPNFTWGMFFWDFWCGFGRAENWGIVPLFYVVICLEMSS